MDSSGALVPLIGALAGFGAMALVGVLFRRAPHPNSGMQALRAILAAALAPVLLYGLSYTALTVTGFWPLGDMYRPFVAGLLAGLVAAHLLNASRRKRRRAA